MKRSIALETNDDVLFDFPYPDDVDATGGYVEVEINDSANSGYEFLMKLTQEECRTLGRQFLELGDSL